MPTKTGAVAAATPRAHAQNRVCFGFVHPGSPGVEQGVFRGHVWVRQSGSFALRKLEHLKRACIETPDSVAFSFSFLSGSTRG